MTRLYYKEASACIIMFDVTSKNTFQNCLKWKRDLDSKVTLPNGHPVPCMLLANKSDLSPWAVTVEEVERFSKESGFIGWIETSVKENKNIHESMRVIVENIMAKDSMNSVLPCQGDYINLKAAEASDALQHGCC
ncbi:ras-related protein Rab-7L1 isoform X2 [Latimeria chalumnae]|nr:PREDICTED: ras-related protein Rab-7L1 isoform X2 [Latimeria chalumnae]XP_006010972.1 PREDICTED: ras-related protein Rab-7L1 isoform X2 [Latimeria chalumnae]XP_014353155.1 PREDICTED: ras-related protein Rab-7L1 isoform X2 [Latimeria chalumnae]|eukprot:XP_006010971.1 PREDICTED: ras-related protein Rab-7L1 isoform X2 [Latimeria chalumnae]